VNLGFDLFNTPFALKIIESDATRSSTDRLYVAFYNFCRANQAAKKTPAMAAGLTDHARTIGELLSR
jgi:hypothetical protein